MKSLDIRKIFAILSCYLICLVTIAASAGAWWYDVNLTFGQQFPRLTSIKVLVCIVIVLALISRKIQVERIARVKILISVFCIFSFRFFNTTNEEAFTELYVIFCGWITLFFLLIGNKQVFWKAFVNIVVGISLISLFFYIFGSLLHFISPLKMTSLTWGPWNAETKNYYYIYYESHILHLSKTTGAYLVRNTGFYPEGPMFNMILCIALGAEVLFEKSFSRFKVLVLVTTILTTFCTTGLLYIGLLCIYWLIKERDRLIFLNQKLSIKWILAGGILLLIALFLTKFLTKSGSGSTSIRWDHLMACIKAWWSAKMTGVGYLNIELVKTFMERPAGISVGLPYMFACGGLFLGCLPVFYAIINGVESIKAKQYPYLVFEFLFLFLETLTIYFATPLYVLVLGFFVTLDPSTEQESS